MLFVPSALGAGCNAIFGIDDPEHRTGDTGASSGSPNGGANATGGKGSSGSSTGGKSGTSSGDGGTSGTPPSGGRGGDAGMPTGGASGDAGMPTGGAGGGGSCPDDPSDCEPPDVPSCVGLSKTACAGESCCSSPIVAGCSMCAFPSGHQSSVSSFRLDEFEVTVARFRNYVNAYTGPPASNAGASVPGTGWSPTWDASMPGTAQALRDHVMRCGTTSTYTPDAGQNEQKPINCLSWYEAFAFCAYDGGFLPTEVQRTYAAADGTLNFRFPWGTDELDHTHALWGYCSMGFSTSCALDDITEVGSFPTGVGFYGQHDLTGSMWEWVFDYQGDVWPIGENCTDCVNTVPQSGGARQIRGGGWTESMLEQPVTWRMSNDLPDSVWKNVGVRCARGI
ncbi:MAG TPA: formylglycine-generating enzyme family protein [Polyangiaceae bacterium]